jgi:hypothetical protein
MIPQNAFVQFKVVTIRNIHSLDHWINQWPFGNIVQARMPFFYYWPQRIAFHEKAKLSHIEVFYPNAYQSPLKMLDDLFANAARSRKMKQKRLIFGKCIVCSEQKGFCVMQSLCLPTN